MNFEKSDDGKILTVKLIGEIDSINISEVETALLQELDGVTDLTFDLAELEYISSAGLRMLHKTQKRMKTQGSMIIRNANDEVMQIFKVAGFLKLLNIARD